jgi:hypothetical protein
MENAEITAEPKLPRGMAIASVALAVPGLVIPPLGIIAVILGIVSLVRASAGRAGGKGAAIAGLVVGAIGTFTSFICMIAAIAIPSLIDARRSSFETCGAANLRAYATAQTMYIKTDWDGDGQKTYAVPFTNLYLDASVAPPKEQKLLDKGFADATLATRLKQGFYFADLATNAGVPINPAADYGLCGAPGAYDRTGTKIYVICVDGRPMGTDAPNVAAYQAGQVVLLINDYPPAATITAQKWSEQD